MASHFLFVSVVLAHWPVLKVRFQRYLMSWGDKSLPSEFHVTYSVQEESRLLSLGSWAPLLDACSRLECGVRVSCQWSLHSLFFPPVIHSNYQMDFLISFYFNVNQMKANKKDLLLTPDEEIIIFSATQQLFLMDAQFNYQSLASACCCHFNESGARWCWSFLTVLTQSPPRAWCFLDCSPSHDGEARDEDVRWLLRNCGLPGVTLVSPFWFHVAFKEKA